MKTTILSRCSLAAGATILLGLAAGTAHAAVLAYEPVDGYAEGTLNGQAIQGAGFDTTQNWSGNNLGGGWFVNVVAGGLTFSQNGQDLMTTGDQHVEQAIINGGWRGWLDVSGGGPFSSYLQGNQIGQGTIYFSYLATNDGTTWQPRGTVTSGDAVNHLAQILTVTDSQVHLFVGKVEFNAGGGGEDLFSSWVDPTPGSAEGDDGTTVDVQTALSGTWTDGFDKWFPRGGGFMAWDEVRFGESWADVTPTATVVPEPSTFVLAALGLIGVVSLVRRRRRKCS